MAQRRLVQMIRPPGLILCGGESRRFGGRPKGLMDLGGVALLDRIVARISPQTERIVLSVHDRAHPYTAAGLPALHDSGTLRQGPLSGIVAGLAWAAAEGHTLLMTVPVDTPFLPDDLCARLVAAIGADTDVALAVSHHRMHPTVGVWRTDMAEPMKARLARGELRLQTLGDALHAARVDFGNGTPDPFFNVNTPQDLAVAAAYLDAAHGQPHG